MNPDDIDKEKAQNAAGELADNMEGIDEGRDKRPYWAFLIFFFGTSALAIGLLVQSGYIKVPAQTLDNLGISWFVRWGLRALMGLVVICILVVAPGDYLAAISRTVHGYHDPKVEDDDS